MSLRFCECGGLLEEKANETLEFVCVACGRIRSAKAEDTLLQEELTDQGVVNYDVHIRTAPFDRLNPIMKMHCAQCKKDTYVNHIYLGDELTIVYSCLDCHHQWSN